MQPALTEYFSDYDIILKSVHTVQRIMHFCGRMLDCLVYDHPVYNFGSVCVYVC